MRDAEQLSGALASLAPNETFEFMLNRDQKGPLTIKVTAKEEG